MSTTSDARFLRSGSKPRSVGSVAGPSVARSNRGRGSRRGASPAVTADAPEDDNDQLDPQNPRAYGMQGKPAEVQIQEARLAQRQAVDPIKQAVSGAEGQNGGTNRLTAVDEEDESGFRDNDPFTPNSPFVYDPPTQLRFPTHGRQGDEFHYRDSSILVAPRSNIPTWVRIYATLLNNSRLLALSLVFLGCLIYLLCGSLHTCYSKIRESVSSVGVSLPHKISTREFNTFTQEFNTLNHRLEHVEQQLQNWPTDPTMTIPTVQHQINWFTPGFGAMIDVHLSSPTTTICDPTWKPFPVNLFRQSCPQIPISPPHKMALQTWDDPVYDRWCSPNSGGKVQLTVEIERHIMPTELVVEYMAKEASPTGYMDSAPKEIELWIRVEDEEVRSRVSDAIGRSHPELWVESSPQQRELHLSRQLGHEFIHVGRWIYNIYEQSPVQAFKIPTPLLKYGVDTTKFAIRVNSNWGNVDFTCINRFRMHGVDMSGIMDDLEK